MKVLSRVAWAVPAFALFTSAPAYAIELSVAEPLPTVHGNETVFKAELSGAAGTGEVRWDFGDGTQTEFSASGGTATHTYEKPGHYSVIVVARDDDGFTSHSFLHTVHEPLAAGEAQSSSPLLFDEARGLVITANTDNGTVTLVDVATLEKVAEIKVFSHPVALALAPDGKLWVVHQDDYAIAIVDLDERRAVDFFRLPYASLPAGIVFSPSGDAYVPLMALGDVVRIDGATHEIEAQRHVAPFLRGITISGDGSSLWVTRFISQGDHGEVYRLDAQTLESLARYDLMEDTTTEDSDVQGRGLPNYIFSVAVEPNGKRAWVPAKKDNMYRGLKRDGLALTQDSAVRPLVSILDLTTDQEILERRIDLDDRNLPRHVTFSPLGDWAFVTVYGSNLIELRDAFTGSFVTALRGEHLLSPVASVLTPDDHLMVLADSARKLVVYDVNGLLTGTDLATEIVAEVDLVAEEKLPPDVLRGKQIFSNAEDKRMSSEGYLSCASCHLDGFEDGMVWDFFDRGEGFRNTISLLGRRGMGHGRVHWSGNFDEIQDFDNPIRAHQAGLGFMPLEEFQKGTRSEPLGDPKAGVDPDLDALAAYVASLDRVPRSPFRNPDGSLTAEGEAGREIFLSLGCDTCHSGEDFTDSAQGVLHDVGTLTELSGNRLGGELAGIDTPTLLGIWQTAPYLHDGSAPTLRDVLVTRNPDGLHGETASLSEQELAALEAYLLQIDHGTPPEELTLPEPELPGGAGGSGAGGTSGGTGGLAGTPGSSTGGSEANGAPPSAMPISESGCGCKVTSHSPASRSALGAAALAVLGLALRRRRFKR
jgi:MYXO-CTERM domain-containing protein